MTWSEYEEGLFVDDWQNDDNMSVGSKGSTRTGFTQDSYYSHAASQQNPGAMPPGKYVTSCQFYLGGGTPSAYNMSTSQSFYGGPQPDAPSYMMPDTHMSYMSGMPGLVTTAAPPYYSPSPYHSPPSQ